MHALKLTAIITLDKIIEDMFITLTFSWIDTSINEFLNSRIVQHNFYPKNKIKVEWPYAIYW